MSTKTISGFSAIGDHSGGNFGTSVTSISNKRPPYKAYRSPFGPQYTSQLHFHGITKQVATKYVGLLGAFGGVAGVFALFFFAEVPKVRDDIMMKVPILQPFFKKEIAPEDNPF